MNPRVQVEMDHPRPSNAEEVGKGERAAGDDRTR
jgi:hypothetical protein